MSDQKSVSINLFHRFIAFRKENSITALSPVQVMADLHNEINVPVEELYTLADKLIDGIFSTDDPFLYGERIVAIRNIVENGISGNAYLDDMTPAEAYRFLLDCPVDIFISIVDVVARVNQEYYTAEWGPESGHDEVINQVNQSIEEFLHEKPSLDAQIRAAAGISGEANLVNTVREKENGPERF